MRRPVLPWQVEPTLRYLAMLPLAMAATIIATEGLAQLAVGPEIPRPAWLLAAGTGVLHALAILLLLPLLRFHQFDWNDAFGLFRRGWPKFWLQAALLTLPALALAWLLHHGSGSLLDSLGVSHDEQSAVEAVRKTQHAWELALLFLFAVITAPITEEILFRGILWPLVRERGWSWKGALAVALAFSAIHANLTALLPLWFLGLFWTWLYERTADITVPILSHALFNATNFAWILLAPTSLPTPP